MKEEKIKSTNEAKLELRNRGIISIVGEIKDDMIKSHVDELIFLNEIKNPDFQAIQIILNSPGGSTRAGFVLIDAIEFSNLPVYILGLGICASMGMTILCSGTKGHRTITENTDLLCHQYLWGNAGKYHELVANRKQEDILHERLIRHYVKHSKLSRRQVQDILLSASDKWLTPKEAKKYGLIDKIIKK